jgi:hypothetical protein
MTSKIYAVLIIVSLLLAGCGGKAAVDAAASEAPPELQEEAAQEETQAPEHELKCNINTQAFDFGITGETGEVRITYNNETVTSQTDSSGVITEVTTNVNRDLLFTSSQHKYHIEGTITVNQKTNEVTYDITVTGDTLGDTPLICKNQ